MRHRAHLLAVVMLSDLALDEGLGVPIMFGQLRSDDLLDLISGQRVRQLSHCGSDLVGDEGLPTSCLFGHRGADHLPDFGPRHGFEIGGLQAPIVSGFGFGVCGSSFVGIHHAALYQLTELT